LTITRLAWRARHASIAASRWMANEASSALGRGARRPHPQAPTALLLAWFFPPVVSGGTYRPLSLVRYGARLGWQFAVLGSSRPTSAAGEHLLQRVPANVKVARIDRNDGGFFFDVDLILGMIAAVALAALILGLAQRDKRLGSDAILGILASLTLAAGVIVVSAAGTVRVDLFAFLFGDILAVRMADLVAIYLAASAALRLLGL